MNNFKIPHASVRVIVALATSLLSQTFVLQSALAAPAAVKGDCVSACKSWLNRADLSHSRVGVEVMELPSGKVIFESSGSKRFTPASTAKVITTACIYDLLGPNYTFKTRLVTGGTLSAGVLKGDLILETSQDPSFTRDNLVKLIRDSGITQIDGSVMIACPPDGHDNYAVSWLAEDFGQDWMPVSSNLVIDRNIAFVSGIPRQVRQVESKGTGLAILDTLIASGIGSGWLSLDPTTNVCTISRGTAYGANGKIDTAVKRDGPFVVANPDTYNAALVQSVLNDLNIKVRTPTLVALGSYKEPRTILSEHASKPLSQIVRLCLHESDNLYAQQLLRSIALASDTKINGKVRTSRGESRTLEEKGLMKVGEWLSSLNVPGREVVLFDGCGLSRKDCLTPHALNVVLKHMAAENLDGPYLDLLRAAGEGASSYRFKTGAMDTVRAISGILVNNYKQTEAVTIMINGHTPSVKELRIALSDLIERLKRAAIARESASSTTTKPTSTSSGAATGSAVKKSGRTAAQQRRH
jgi:D-alanyl-D-alanine carboxypeptidase/D-alanyl-D-alanine-endopeptidase (penicillin-binding protein 4)